MEKITHFLLLLFAFLGASTVSAQTTTATSRPGELITQFSQLSDGDYIYLYCPANNRDVSGKRYFDKTRTTGLGNSNFYKVVFVGESSSSFYLQRCSDGNYLQKRTSMGGGNTASTFGMTTTQTDAATFSFEDYSTGGTISDAEKTTGAMDTDQENYWVRLVTYAGDTKCYLNVGSNNGCTYWKGNGSYSVWLVYKVINSKSLNQADDGKYYATIFLPYDAQVEEGVTAYYGTISGEQVDMTEFTDRKIPANHGALLVSGSKTKTALTVNSETLSFTKTDALEGTNVAKTIDNKDDYYVFGQNSTNSTLGFYHPNSTTLKANCAYIFASNVPSSEENALRLSFDGTSTGISAVESAQQGAEQTLYDLTGRRVAKASHGIYIQNGKKVFVK